MANATADALVGLCIAELAPDEANRIKTILDLAAKILARIEVVALSLINTPVNRARCIVPPTRPRVSYATKLRQARRDTEHLLVTAGRKVRCTKCLGIPKAQKLVQWLHTKCPGGPRGGPEGSPHPSHELSVAGAFVFCRRCGGFGSTSYKSLSGVCQGRPRTHFAGLNLLRLRRGMPPRTTGNSAVGMTLEITG